MPEVSVVIPLYNKAPYVEAALDSVRAQSFEDLEIVVVDDGSSDGGPALVERLDDRRIVLIRQANAGAGAARNTGIAAVRGRWIAFLDADDLWQPDKLARQLELLHAHPEVSWAAGAYVRTAPGELPRNSSPVPFRLFAAEGVIDDALALLAAGCAIWTSTVMIRRGILDRLGSFDPTLRVGQDRDLWVRLAVDHPRLVYAPETVAVKREVPASLSALKLAEGFSTALELARRRAEIAKALPPERAALLRAFGRTALEQHARKEFAADRSQKAQEALHLLRMLKFGDPSWSLRVAAQMPGSILLLLANARRRLRRWLARNNIGFHTSTGGRRALR